MAPLRIGICGFRGVAHSHFRGATACSKTRVVAVADLDAKQRAIARDEYGVTNLYEDYRELIDDPQVDVVAVVLPPGLHHPATTAALKAGKHVICEKPPAADAREAGKMVELARSKGLRLSWGLQLRFSPEMHAARSLRDAGRFGNIYRIETRRHSVRFKRLKIDRPRMLRQGGGPFFDFGVHVLDMAWSLLDCPRPVRVVAHTRTMYPEWNAIERPEDMAEDTAFAMFFFEDESMISVDAAYVSNRRPDLFPTREMQVLGDKGGFHSPTRTYTTGGYGAVRHREIKIRKSWERHMHHQLYTNFANAVAGKEELLIKAEHGLALQKMLDGVIRSGREGKEIELK